MKKNGKDMDWDGLISIVERSGIKPMFKVINATCVAELGLDVKLFPFEQFDPQKKIQGGGRYSAAGNFK